MSCWNNFNFVGKLRFPYDPFLLSLSKESYKTTIINIQSNLRNLFIFISKNSNFPVSL